MCSSVERAEVVENKDSIGCCDETSGVAAIGMRRLLSSAHRPQGNQHRGKKGCNGNVRRQHKRGKQEISLPAFWNTFSYKLADVKSRATVLDVSRQVRGIIHDCVSRAW